MTVEVVMDKLLFTPFEAATALGIGRSKVYELLRSGTCPQYGSRCLPPHPGGGPDGLPGNPARRALTVHVIKPVLAPVGEGGPERPAR